MAVTAPELRQNIYRLLDRVLETGQPPEITRKGKVLRIVPAEASSKLSRLRPRDVIKGDPEELGLRDWTGEWNPEPD